MSARNPGQVTIIPAKEAWVIPAAAKAPGTFPIKANVRVTNRAKKGALRNKPVMLSHAGHLYPEDLTPGDERSYLQPGDSMIVPGDLILHNFFTICHHKERGAFSPEQKMEIANKFGGYVGNPAPIDGAHGNQRNETVRIIAPPQYLPDLIIQQIDSRGKDFGEAVSVYEVVTEGIEFLPVSEGSRKLDRRIILAEPEPEEMEDETPTKKK